MKKLIEKILFLEDKQILKWGRFNAYMNLIIGCMTLLSPIVIMTVIQDKATQIANIRRVEADSLNGLSFFDSSNEFCLISHHLNRDAHLIQGLLEIFSILMFFIGIGLINAGISQFKLHKLLKEKVDS